MLSVLCNIVNYRPNMVQQLSLNLFILQNWNFMPLEPWLPIFSSLQLLEITIPLSFYEFGYLI